MIRACLTVAVGVAAHAASAQPTITDLGILPAASGTEVSGVSADGSVVVGISGDRAFRWTQASGMQSLGPLPGDVSSEANGVNANGAVIVGRSNAAANAAVAVQWGGMAAPQSLGLLPGAGRSIANAASGDGSIIVGYVTGPTPPNYSRAFRWTLAGGMQDLGTLAGHDSGYAAGISGDGTIIVGSSGDVPARWTGSSVEALGPYSGMANAISFDGSTVVGTVVVSGNVRGFRWRSAEGFQLLDSITCAAGCYPGGVNGDGSVVVGRCVFSSGANRAFVWTAERGTSSLSDYLRALGVDLTGWNLERATGISADGATIVGFGMVNGSNRGWTVRGLPATAPASCYPNCDGSTASPVLNAIDFTCFLNSFAAGDTYANCDDSCVSPVLNALDFTCFLTRFAAGCL